MIGKALKRTRQFHRMKQVDLAERLGLSKSYLSEIESDTKVPSLDVLQKYSEAFGVPVSSFLLFSESMESGEPKFKPARKVMRIMDWITEDLHDGS